MSGIAPRSLGAKLILAFALVSVLGVGLASLLAHWVTVREFERFFQDKNRAEFVAGAGAYYQAHGTWEGVDADLVRRAPLPGAALRQPPPSFALLDAQGVVVAAAAPYGVGERVPSDVSAAGEPVLLDGRRVGTVLDAARRPTLSDREAQYLASTDRALGLAALGAVALALVLGIALARGLTEPVRDLTRAVQAMTGGELGQQVPIRSADELGELSGAFNRMSAELARSNRARRQMTADIAHDLRTPLSVLTGYIEGLRDGVLTPTADRLETMHTEAQHLRHLVEDLRTLSLADAGELPLERRPVVPSTVLARLAAAFGPEATARSIALETACEAQLPAIDIDLERLVQALGNIVANALRHTPAGGRVVLAAARAGADVALEVTDDGEGIASDVLPHIFDRLYQGDAARSRQGAASGLGLAIAMSIVRAHGGTLTARSLGIGRGSTFTVRLPARRERSQAAVDGAETL